MTAAHIIRHEFPAFDQDVQASGRPGSGRVQVFRDLIDNPEGARESTRSFRHIFQSEAEAERLEAEEERRRETEKRLKRHLRTCSPV